MNYVDSNRSKQIIKFSLPIRLKTAFLPIAIACTGLLFQSEAVANNPVMIGERPAVEHHLDQQDIIDGMLQFEEIFKYGDIIFNARFNTLDGQGRPATTGTGSPRIPDQPAFIRTSAPESNSCSGCHNQPGSGGAGDFVANVYVLAQALDPVTYSVSPEYSNERNTLGMNGAGPIEMLAREMTSELISIREHAKAIAQSTGQPASETLQAKGVHFGTITVMPNGKVDPSEIEGVDWDLIIKPFHQKGAVVSIREFTNNAMNHHHGIQSVERFGADVDPDQDGYINELTVGDITAVTVYQAAIATPGRIHSENNKRKNAAKRGEKLFRQINCTSCHIPALSLSSNQFVEPNPYNPPGNLGNVDTGEYYVFEMDLDNKKPIVNAFTDLKRHNLNDDDYIHFANEQLAQGTLAGFADPEDFTTPPEPRPTEAFLTRKLWDVGNSDPYGHRGDLTTMTEAINFHGGEARLSRDAYFSLPQKDQNAIIEFLKTLQVLPEAANDMI